MLTYNQEGSIIDDKSWLVINVDNSNVQWTVVRVRNDEQTFDIILFNQETSEKLVIFDYLNGNNHTEITGDIDY